MTLRPMRPADLEAVNRLHRSVWWPARSRAGWAWLWSNPATRALHSPNGWVIDNGGGAVACAGNFIQRFWLDDRALYGATGYSIIVPPDQRGRSRDLIHAFVNQPGCFARYTLNANARSSPLYKRHGMTPWPPLTHDVKLSWLVDPLACLYGRGLRHIVDQAPLLARLLGEQLSPLPRLLGGRRLQNAQARLPSTVSLLDDLTDGSDYDQFWQALRGEGRLIADRSPAIMRWRLSDPDLTVPPLALAYREKGRITGFALAMLNKQTPLEPPILEVIDLVALQTDPEAVQSLLEGLRILAPTLGAAKVRLQATSPELLQALGPLIDKAHREGGWGHCHVAFNAGMQDAGWRPTPYDGDYSFCLRPLPARASAALRLAPAPARRSAVKARA
ncbi:MULTISPECIES: GNAT family N-acetyltransferase [Brevundimonas]|uniref:GNAT family N-acetyltransferase n=1 Tax=Brevundimonas sp. 357 TaxID=2555782 RepID=UPI000F766C98|nr:MULTISPECIES: GNAT family N-acetyltransferase [Brevundimonas]RSB45098.1 N-acetyltransferase [Brevundimonas sp. 357]